MHVDMDAFFASVEILDRPELKGRPVVVGADPARGRGVISAASYEARKFGLRSAMPVSRAVKLCPHAVFMPPRFRRYSELSAEVMQILADNSREIEQVSIDEAYIDITYNTGSDRENALLIKRLIKEKTGLTASVGLASNRITAKIASDFHKPDGVCIIPCNREVEFMSPLPVEKLPGIGRKTLPLLHEKGIYKIGDLASLNEEQAYRLLGRHGHSLRLRALGRGSSELNSDRERKSISEERTFEVDIDDSIMLRQTLSRLAGEVAERMKKNQFKGRTVHIKIRFDDFETHTRSKTLPVLTRDQQMIRETARALLAPFLKQRRKVRLIGVGLSNLLVDGQGQLSLFD